MSLNTAVIFPLLPPLRYMHCFIGKEKFQLTRTGTDLEKLFGNIYLIMAG